MGIVGESRFPALAWVLGACAVLTVAVVMFSNTPTTNERLAVAKPDAVVKRVAGELKASGVMAAASMADAGAPRLTERSGPSEKLRRDFENSTNYGEFIRNVLSRPAEGGRFYAAMVYFRCAQLGTFAIPVAPGEQISENRQRAIDALAREKDKCGSALDQYGSVQDIYAILAAPSPVVDPLMPDPLRVFGGKSDDPGFAKRDFDRAMRLGDPYDIGWATENYGPEVAYEFNASLRDKRLQPIVYSAVSSVACEATMACERSVPFLVGCAVRGICDYAGYPEQIRSELKTKEEWMAFDIVRVYIARKLGLPVTIGTRYAK